MSIVTVDSGERDSLENNCFDGKENNGSCWNGRIVQLNNNPTLKITLCSGTIRDYFDSEKKKQNEFDVAVYQYHVRCNSEESKKHLESAFEKMAAGMVGVVVGVAYFSPAGAFMIWNCGKMIWQGVEEFKKAMEASQINLDEVTFVTWNNDLKRNTKELMKSSILEPWRPLETPNYHYNDNPHYTRPLDSWRYV